MWYWKDRWTISYQPGWDRWILSRTHFDRTELSQLHPSKANSSPFTLPRTETSSLHLKKWMVGRWSFLLGWPIFRGELFVLGCVFSSIGFFVEIFDYLAMFDSEVPACDRKTRFVERWHLSKTTSTKRPMWTYRIHDTIIFSYIWWISIGKCR